MHTHHGIYDTVLEQDELRDHDRHKDLKKDKLTLTECVVALAIAITFVSLHAIFLGKCPSDKLYSLSIASTFYPFSTSLVE